MYGVFQKFIPSKIKDGEFYLDESVLLYKLFSGAVMTSLGYFIEHWYKPFIVKTINIMMVDPELMSIMTELIKDEWLDLKINIIGSINYHYRFLPLLIVGSIIIEISLGDLIFDTFLNIKYPFTQEIISELNNVP